jgi:PadR family transcriptional regulator PadR
MFLVMDADAFRNWTHQTRKGLLELAILNDIRRRGMYGYEIEKEFRRTQGLSVSSGALYHVLQRLQEQGLARSTEARSPDGPKRKYYDLTEKGRETLVQMNTHWQAIKRQLESIAKA